MLPIPCRNALGHFIGQNDRGTGLGLKYSNTLLSAVATRQGEISGVCPQSSDFADYTLEILNSDWRSRAESVFDAY
jgi:hypothetical protein